MGGYPETIWQGQAPGDDTSCGPIMFFMLNNINDLDNFYLCRGIDEISSKFRLSGNVRRETVGMFALNSCDSTSPG